MRQDLHKSGKQGLDGLHYECLNQPVSESSWEELSATVSRAAGVLGGEDPETWMSLDQGLSLGDEELSVVVQDTVQGFEDVGWSQVELVEDDPVAHSHRSSQNAFLKYEQNTSENDLGHTLSIYSRGVVKNIMGKNTRIEHK